jgi:NADH dehydrogenase
MLGQVATLGRYKGIALVFGVPLRGFIGWFVTRTYHLYQLPLFSRKLRVVTDWTVALLFRGTSPSWAGSATREARR